MHRFVLVRHATPLHGDDPGLSARGRTEAIALAKRLGGWRFDAAWSSNLNRALQTAELILAGHQSLTLRVSSLLREVELPSEPGQQLGQPGYQDWEKDAFARVTRDLSEWLKLVTAGPDEDGRESPPTTLVVSHAGPLRMLICLLLGLPVEAQWSFRVDWASLTVVEWAGDLGTITLLNDRCHLEIDRDDR